MLSILALMVVGAGDMVSSIIRQTIIQITTPDEMRGRVFAVNALFVGSSAQLGGFTSGTMAALIGAVPAVVVGGCAVVATVALWAWLFPATAPHGPAGRAAAVLIRAFGMKIRS